MYKLIIKENKELQMGIKKEMEEHGMSYAKAKKTAADHLKENPHYYTVAASVGLEDEETMEEALAALNGIPAGKNWPFTRPAGRLRVLKAKYAKARAQGSVGYAGPGQIGPSESLEKE
jgi:hypothetical protein